MEGQSGNEIPLQFISLNFGGKANEVSHVPEDDPYRDFFMADGKSGNQTNAQPLHQWIQNRKLSHDYVEYLAESSTFLPKASTEDMLERIPLTVSGMHPVVDGVSEFQSDILYNHLGKAPASSSLGMDASKARFLGPHGEGEPVNKFTGKQHQIYAQNYGSRAQESIGDHYNVSQRDHGVTVAPGFLSKPQRNVPRRKDGQTDSAVPRRKGSQTDRNRRQRIAERLDALQELLPHSAENDEASVLDDIIDHIKYLQLQIKDLSQSRLEGESSTEPFIFLEGYGHYISQQMLNEPLEEMIGKLLEENPLAAAQLLESKGLFMMNMDFAENLRQAI